MSRSLFRVAVLALFGFAAVEGQTQDTSQNGLLKGNYRFRHVAIQTVDANGNPTQVTATYGLIAFDGAGNYTITGTQVDNTVSSGAPQAFTTTGTYAIGSNGAGYVSSPLFSGYNEFDFGALSQGVFTGSSTEAGFDGYVLNDILIVIPTGTVPTNASFTAAYQAAVLDFTGGGVTAIKNALFELSANGAGGFGTITLTGQASNQTAASVTQTVTGATYGFNSDGSATLNIPLPSGGTSANALFTGTKTIFESTDGNFILGWTPGGYDIFFGVKALAITGTNSITKGLYFTSGLEDSPSTTSGSGADSYYGGLNSFGDSNGDAIVHARLNFPNSYPYDYGSDDQFTLNADGSIVNPDFTNYLYIFGDGGQAFVGIGTGGNYALVVGMQAAKFSGPGVYLYPDGVVNAASYQPITASLAPGELITLYGTGLSSVTMTTPGGQAFPTLLGGVSVSIDTIPCAIYYVSPTQIAAIVPYELAQNQTGLANIQVSNNGTLSNVVQTYFQDSAPGSFSQNQLGIGYASARHAASGAPLNSANPAQPGEYISLYLTGLGTVTPGIADGALGPTGTLSVADIYPSNLTVLFNDYTNGSTQLTGAIQFAGLAPGLAGLYQINVQVPATGLGAGDLVYVEFATDSADVNQIQIPFGSGSSGSSSVRPARPSGRFAQKQKARPSHSREPHA